MHRSLLNKPRSHCIFSSLSHLRTMRGPHLGMYTTTHTGHVCLPVDSRVRVGSVCGRPPPTNVHTICLNSFIVVISIESPFPAKSLTPINVPRIASRSNVRVPKLNQTSRTKAGLATTFRKNSGSAPRGGRAHRRRVRLAIVRQSSSRRITLETTIYDMGVIAEGT
ncbi:hypothetical protein BD779DRAFT_113602 [Infundibulicybe gibba]|nr:hypothetical protein BD779DRAFT_113602 [Infundibulicybe gibba]